VHRWLWRDVQWLVERFVTERAVFSQRDMGVLAAAVVQRARRAVEDAEKIQAAAARAAARTAGESARVDRALRAREESLARRVADASSARTWARARRALMSASYRRKLNVRTLALVFAVV
jgi:hypothetical protein